MGSCLFGNGVFYKQTTFDVFMTGMIASLILVALSFLAIPTFIMVMNTSSLPYGNNRYLKISWTIAGLLLFFYIVYLFFELRSHSDLYSGFEDNESEEDQGTNLEPAEVILSPTPAILWLIISVICLILCVWNVTSRVNDISFRNNGMFIGFILFPFLGNITDFIQACIVASRNHMDLTILVTLGSSMQILLFTLPVLVFVGRVIQQPMTLEFGMFELVTTFISLFIVNLSIQLGTSNYLLGATYISLCVVKFG